MRVGLRVSLITVRIDTGTGAGWPVRERVGVWMVGARGSVGTTATVGAAALKAGLTGTTGLVTALPPFAAAGLPSLHDLVFAGHDLVQTPLLKRADALAEQGVLP